MLSGIIFPIYLFFARPKDKGGKVRRFASSHKEIFQRRWNDCFDASFCQEPQFGVSVLSVYARLEQTLENLQDDLEALTQLHQSLQKHGIFEVAAKNVSLQGGQNEVIYQDYEDMTVPVQLLPSEQTPFEFKLSA